MNEHPRGGAVHYAPAPPRTRLPLLVFASTLTAVAAIMIVGFSVSLMDPHSGPERPAPTCPWLVALAFRTQEGLGVAGGLRALGLGLWVLAAFSAWLAVRGSRFVRRALCAFFVLAGCHLLLDGASTAVLAATSPIAIISVTGYPTTAIYIWDASTLTECVGANLPLILVLAASLGGLYKPGTTACARMIEAGG